MCVRSGTPMTVLEDEEVTRALRNSDTEYIREYNIIENVCHVMIEIEDFNPSIELIDYLIETKSNMREILIVCTIREGLIDKLKYIVNNYESNECARDFLTYLIYSKLDRRNTQILNFLIEYHKNNLNLDNILQLKSAICMVGVNAYHVKDCITYITNSIINNINDTNNLLSNVEPTKVEGLLKIVLCCNGPNSLIELLLLHINEDSNLHSPITRDNCRTRKPKGYVSLFDEDI